MQRRRWSASSTSKTDALGERRRVLRRSGQEDRGRDSAEEVGREAGAALVLALVDPAFSPPYRCSSRSVRILSASPASKLNHLVFPTRHRHRRRRRRQALRGGREVETKASTTRAPAAASQAAHAMLGNVYRGRTGCWRESVPGDPRHARGNRYCRQTASCSPSCSATACGSRSSSTHCSTSHASRRAACRRCMSPPTWPR